MVLMVAADRADELALLAVLRLHAQRQQQTAAVEDTDRVGVAAVRIAVRAARAEAQRRGLELQDDERQVLEGDTPRQEQADVDVLLAAFESTGGHAAYRLGEWRRHAAEWVALREVLGEILANTPPEYVQTIQDELLHVIGSERPERALYLHCGTLTRRAWSMAERVVGTPPWAPNNYDGPLALPESVCRALLENPREGYTGWAYTCGACGYEVPTCWAQRDASGEFVGYLPCPVCTGEVGYCAWYETKRAHQESGAR